MKTVTPVQDRALICDICSNGGYEGVNVTIEGKISYITCDICIDCANLIGAITKSIIGQIHDNR